jgi:hypothetical protein
MNFKDLCRATAIVLLFVASSAAQQRPLLTEDPRTIDDGTLVAETGFGFQNRARFPVSGLTGDLYSILDSGLHFGLGKRAEFQMTGTIHNYLRLENDAGSRNDWGDLALSTKIKLVDEGRSLPVISFRPTVVLPNASITKGIGTDGTNFFGDLLFGKSVRSAFLFGSIGLGILDDPTKAAAQQDVLTFGIAGSVPVSKQINVLAEWNGRHNAETNPSPGGESRGQIRVGLQIKALGVRWDAAGTAGTTDWDHKAGFVAGLSKEFQLHK